MPRRQPGSLARVLSTASLLALLAAGALAQVPSPQWSAEARLASLWAAYRQHHITPLGAVTDPLRQGRVTSEAQSYALLRAVWMRDRATFERVLGWTDTHLRRPDGLYAWLWDPAEARVIDRNLATDADIDIAYALAMASIVFEHPGYAVQARDVVVAIRTHAAVDSARGWFPAAGNWAVQERIINLSYFYPYATPWFERLDPGMGWARTNDLGYALIEAALSAAPLALPADFNRLAADGTVQPLPEGHALSAQYSYDAMRISWRLEMACRLRREVQACRVSETLTRRLQSLLERDGRIVTQYGADGAPRTAEQSSSFYAAMLPAFTRLAPAVARGWRATHLGDAALDALAQADDRYYDANWVWFGIAGADGVLDARTPALDRLRVPR